MLNKDEIGGKSKQFEGALKDKAGDFVTNPDLEAEGKAERLEGEVQGKVGEVHRNAGEAVEKAEPMLLVQMTGRVRERKALRQVH